MTTLDEILARYMNKDDPNFIGEALRDWAFIKDGEHSYGCYSTFDLLKDFKPKEFTLKEFTMLMGRYPEKDRNDFWGWDDNEVFKRASWFVNKNNGIEVGWYWDGDGILTFYVPEENIIVSNSDCKKSDEWEFQ